MTKYFEIIQRDGTARLGELKLSDPIQTPALCDDFIHTLESSWATDKEVNSIESSDKLSILPYRNFPSGTGPLIENAFFIKPQKLDHPTASVISPRTASNLGTDAYVLSTSQSINGSPKNFSTEIIQTRMSIPSDSLLYTPAIATPQNIAFLVYMGVDLFDTTNAVLLGLQGQYLLPTGHYPIDSMDDLPCSCSICSSHSSGLTNLDCVEHNVNTLKSELNLVKNHIKSNTLREYLEGQIRHSTWLTAAFRYVDSDHLYLEQRTPISRRKNFISTTDDSMNRIEVLRFQNRVINRYKNNFQVPLVLVPCSSKKPYSKSKSHRFFHQSINFKAHKISISSPLGIIPQELEMTYPAQHYDTTVTGNWSPTEIDTVSNILSQYLEFNSYPKIIAHVPPGGYKTIVEIATKNLDIPVEYTVEDHPTSSSSLQKLSKSLSSESSFSRHTRMLNMAYAIADYQFGKGAGNILFKDCTFKGKFFPKRIFDTNQIATLIPEYGLFSLTLHGAHKLKNSNLPVQSVIIDKFVPKGSVLAPGVVSASETIRSGDEVIVSGPMAFAVGRAVMNGPEMEQSTRGVAVDVRHVEKY